MADPEVWGDGCECWVTPEHTWTTHYGAVEPGSQVEFNPDCPKHGAEDGVFGDPEIHALLTHGLPSGSSGGEDRG